MSDETQAAYGQLIAYLEHCLSVLDEAAIAPGDLTFLQTFLTHAAGYLSKDATPDTEAVENWDAPENQAMMQRYITHVEQEIRLCIEDWRQAQPDAAPTPLDEKLQALVDGLDQAHQTISPYAWPPVGRYDHP